MVLLKSSTGQGKVTSTLTQHLRPMVALFDKFKVFIR